jgi:hypothetical protein
MVKPDPDLQLVTVFETDNPVLLDLAQAALDDAGISFALSAPSSPEFGFTPLINPVSKILVAEQKSAEAREVLENLAGESAESESDADPEAD